MSRLLISFLLVSVFSEIANAQRKCSTVELSFALTANTTRDDEFLSADSADTRAMCSISNIDVSNSEVTCEDVPHQRRMEQNWPTGSSRDFFFTKTDQLRGIFYVNDRARGQIYVCSATPTNTVQLPCTLVTDNRFQPKGLEMMPPDFDGLAWIETAGRGVFVMGSTIEEKGYVEPQQILLGEFSAIAFDVKPALNQDGKATNLILYAVANNFTMYSLHLVRNGASVSVAGEIIDMGKLRSPSNSTFFARPLSSVVSIAVYDSKVYFATSGSLYRTSLVSNGQNGFSLDKDSYILSQQSPEELHSVSFDGPRRQRPRISRIAIDCQVDLSDADVPCGINSKAKADCEQKQGLCIPKRKQDGSTIEMCVCPMDYAMDSDEICKRWRTPYFMLATKTGIQRYEITSMYTQDAYHGFPTIKSKAPAPPIKADDALFKIKDDLADVTFGASASQAYTFQKFTKRIEHFTTEGEETILLRHEAAATNMQYEPRSGNLYWLDAARHMIMVMDPNSRNNYTRPIFWHKDLVAFHLDSQYSAIIAVLVGPAFAYQNNGFVRHSTLSFKRCNLRGTSCSRAAAEVPIDERNSTFVTAYDIATHKLYVVRDREFPSSQLTLTSIDLNNWSELPNTVRLSVDSQLKEMTPEGQTPLFSVFNDRVYIVISPDKPASSSDSAKPYITLFAGALYRRTNPNGATNSPADIQGPLNLNLESSWSNKVVKFHVGYLYNDPPSVELGRPLNCSRSPCQSGEICIYRTCLCSPDEPNPKANCRRPIDLTTGFLSVQTNYSWSVPLESSDCIVSDFNCISALRRMCDGLANNLPSVPGQQNNDEDLKTCILAGFDTHLLKKSPTILISGQCEIEQNKLCDNITDCSDHSDESATLCTAIRKLPGLCASPIPIRQCFLTPDSLPPTTRNWFFQGRTGGPPPQLSTDAPQCIVDYARPRNFRCVCPTWSQVSDDQTRCIPNNPCLDSETNTDHCAPNGRCRYSEYSRRDFVCDCNPGFISPPGRSDICVDPMTNLNHTNICYQRRNLCGQNTGAGVCIPGSNSDPTSFTCRCNGQFQISRNGMDCVLYRRKGSNIPKETTENNLDDQDDDQTGPCKDQGICGQESGAGECVADSQSVYHCICNEGFQATQDGKHCEEQNSQERIMSDIAKIFSELESNNLVSKSSFSVAFKAFRPAVVITEEMNKFKADASLLATPLLVADERNVLQYSSVRGKRRLLLSHSRNTILGVSSNRLLNLGYILTAKDDAEMEVGAFVLDKKASNFSDNPYQVEFYKTPYIGDPRDLSAPSQFVLDATIEPNMLVYTTNYGRSLVTCSSHLHPDEDHQIAHRDVENNTDANPHGEHPVYGEMDCITLIRDFHPIFRGVDLASRQRSMAWIEIPRDNEYGTKDIPVVAETTIPEIFALEYSKDDNGIFERNFLKRQQVVHPLWTGRNAGEPARHIITAYDSINDRLTWMYGFEHIPDNTPEMKGKTRYGFVVMTYDYTSQMQMGRFFCDMVISQSNIEEIFSSRSRLSISNGVAALTLPDISEFWLFVVPTEDATRVFPIVLPVGRLVHASFPASTPEAYAKPGPCDTCLGVCLSGTEETVCVCPEDDHGHSRCTPLHIAKHKFSWSGHSHLDHPAAKAAIGVIIALLVIGCLAGALVGVVRVCGGVSQTMSRVRYYTSAARGGASPEDFRRLHEETDNDGTEETVKKTKRGFHAPAIFQSNNGYVAFDRNSDNVSVSS